LAKYSKSLIDDDVILIVHRPVYLSIILLGMIYALKAIIVSKSGFNYTSNGIYTLLSIIWTVASIRLSNTIIEKAVIRYFDKTGLKKDLLPLIENLIKFMLILACLFGILIIWDIDIRPFIASAGIMSIIIALAAKDTFANFFGGISLFLDKPFKIGDYIELDNGQRGEVVDIGMRSTRIKTRDDILLSIPNSIIGNSLITNESAPIPQFRIRIPIGVAYGSEIDLVEKLLIEIAVANDNVIPDPAPRVRFRKFGESSLDYELLCWAKEPALRGLTVHELNSSIYKKFNETGIKIPYPQRDLHIKND
jgi:small-conductance mechanosensitive channel